MSARNPNKENKNCISSTFYSRPDLKDRSAKLLDEKMVYETQTKVNGPLFFSLV